MMTLFMNGPKDAIDAFIQSVGSSIVEVFNSTFSENDGMSVKLHTRNKLELEISGNKFISNTGTCLNIEMLGKDYLIKLGVFKNQFRSNTALRNILRIQHASLNAPQLISHNQFISNEIKPTMPEYRADDANDQLALVYLTTGNITFQHNSIQGGSAPFKLTVASDQPNLKVNATHNYWGTTDVNQIVKSIYGYNQEMTRSEVDYFPYSTDADDTAKVDESLPKFADFVQGNEIGGVVRGKETLQPMTYKVTRDIIVEPEATLKIPPGAQLEFGLGSVLQVYGQLSAQGTKEKRIKLSRVEKKNDKNVRISENGVLELNYEGTWRPACTKRGTSNRGLVQIVCPRLGLGKLTKSGTVRNVSLAQRAIAISCKRIWKREEKCEFDPDFPCTTSNYVITVKCDPIYWSGIHFTTIARKTKLAYVDISGAGYSGNEKTSKSAIKVDFMRHQFESIRIDKLYPHLHTKGINIDINDPTSRPEIRNSEIKMNGAGKAIYLLERQIKVDNTTVIQRLDEKGTGMEIFLQNPLFKSMTKMPTHLSFCHPNYTELQADELLLVRVRDKEINRYIKCNRTLQAPPGYIISIQVIMGHVAKCAAKTLFFYNGYSNQSDPIPIKPEVVGPLWVSKGSLVEITMHRVYHYRNPCIDVELAIQAVKQDTKTRTGGFVMENSEIRNFGAGLTISDTFKDFNISKTKFVDNIIGIEFRQRLGRVFIKETEFVKNRGGVVMKNFDGNLTIHNCTFTGTPTSTGLEVSYADNYRPYTRLNVSIEKSLFQFNSKAIRFLKNSRRRKDFVNKVSFVVRNSKFHSNIDGLEIQMYDIDEHGLIRFWLNDSEFWNNTRCLNNVDQHPKKFYWNVTRNTFKESHYQSVRLRGYGSFSGNKVVNSAVKDANIVDIEVRDGFLNFTGNIIKENTLNRSRIKLHVSCDNYSLSGNTISNNMISDKLFELYAREGKSLNVSRMFVNNEFRNNEGMEQGCVKQAVLLISGSGGFTASRNIFANPNVKDELILAHKTTDRNTLANLRNNYWGTKDPQQISSRILDGNDKPWFPKINYSPYFTTEEMNKAETGMSDPNFSDDPDKMGGVVHKDLTLSSSGTYFIARDLVVEKEAKLIIEKGVKLEVSGSASVIIEGAIEMRGTEANPIVVSGSEKRTQDDGCGEPIVRLAASPVDKPNEGRPEIFEEDGHWRPICAQPNPITMANVFCRTFSYSYAVAVWSGRPYSNIWVHPSGRRFRCTGLEESIEECDYYQGAGNCRRNSLNIRCAPSKARPVIYFSGQKKHSILKNVVFQNISRIEVSGNPPLLHNLNFENVDTGLVFIGGGIAHEMDVTIEGVNITESRRSAITLLDITSNVTISGTSITETGKNAIVLQSILANKQIRAPIDHLTSTFSFCDFNRVFRAKPGEEFKLFRAQSSEMTGCQRIIKASSGYAVQITIAVDKPGLIADFFEGDFIGTENRIRTFKPSTKQFLETTATSWGTTMTVLIRTSERSVSFASITSVRQKVNDCSFEEGMCGWDNLKDAFHVERGNWSIYDCSTKKHNDFKGLEKDVTFPSGTNGHYLMIGDLTQRSHCYRQHAAASSARTAIFQSPEFRKENSLCAVSFSFYRRVAYSVRNNRLTLYVQTNETTVVHLWNSTANTNKWVFHTVPLTSIRADAFTLIFHVRYDTGCRNSVGLDNVKLIQCPEEKLVSTISITNTQVQQIPERAIHIENADPQKHNIIWIEKTSVENVGLVEESPPSAVELKLKSAYVLIRNCRIAHSGGQGISLHYNSSTANRVCEARILQNSITFGKSGGAILVNNSGVNDAAVEIRQSEIRHNIEGEKTMIHIVNTSLVFDNCLVHNNTGTYTVQLGGKHIENHKWQNFTNNTFWFNSPQVPAKKHVLAAKASLLHFRENMFNNPAASHEFSLQPIKAKQWNLDLKHNWWGTGNSRSIPGKLQAGHNTKGLKNVEYQPFLSAPPAHFGLASSCPLGWVVKGSRCFKFNVGAVDFENAKRVCGNEGGLILSSFFLTEFEDIIYKMTSYEDLDGVRKNSAIWMTKEDDKMTCPLYEANGKSISTDAKCSELNPFICQKLSIVSCKNGCFQHGLCIGETCLCNGGWEGDDCSKFHCRDVSDCSGHGKCVGPNNCHCKKGWMGRACTISYCDRFGKCRHCVKKTGCGWCDTAQKCVPGDARDSEVGSCKDAWFYYKCITLSTSVGCSGEIKNVSCPGRYCNTTVSSSNSGTCQRCHDVQDCYSNKPNTCKTWSEDKCPKGVVNPDYSSGRILNTVPWDNVKILNPNETIIYKCPYLIPGAKAAEFFITDKDVQLKKGNVILGSQAGGLMHKVVKVVNIDQLNMVAATEADVDEVIKYADFKSEVELEKFEDDLAREQAPEGELLGEFIQDNTTEELPDIKVHVIASQRMFKCIGHTYSKGDEEAYSYYIVAKSDVLNSVAVDDVVVSELTGGFLETAGAVKSNNMGKFVKSRFLQCSEGMASFSIRKPSRKPDMSCFGGDLWPGLQFYDGNVQEVPSTGDTIIGRASESVLGQVLGSFDKDGYRFLEVAAVESVMKGKIVLAGVEGIFERHRRTRRSVARTAARAVGNFAKGFEYNIGAGSRAWFRPSIRMDPRFEVTLKVEYNKWPPSVTWQEVGLVVGGSMKVGMNIGVKFEGSAERAFPIAHPINNKNVGRFVVVIPTPIPIPIPGRIIFDVTVGAKVSVSGAGTASLDFSASGSFHAGFHCRKGSGCKQIGPSSSGSKSEKRNARLGEETGVSLSGSVKPWIRAQWPMALTRSRSKPLPVSVSDKFGEVEVKVKVRERLTTLEGGVAAVVGVSLGAKSCDPSCPDPEKATKLTVSGGMSQMEFLFSAAKWDLEIAVPTSFATLNFIKPICKAQKIPCCMCEDENGEMKPGVIDPKTKECMCECYCDPPDNTIKSHKKKGEECECEECPDGSLKKIYDEIKCPCECKDGKEREMEDDGSCNCECECLDGSKDEIDENGECPCECECKNCEKSKKGPIECDCPNDKCPICENGVEAEWVNCKCECPDDNECGVPPTCVTGRKGPKCEQPHCPGCQSCSGHGVCQAGSGCSSSCACTRQWEGRCCERRRPRRFWGDPHMETLDGVEFDYFGIGQFWDCKSEKNDFGYQVRFFYYKQTSLTGAVALKAGKSVVTITTPLKSRSMLRFQWENVYRQKRCRIDGSTKDIDKVNKFWMSNETVLVDIQPNVGAKATDEESAVSLISFEFKSGVTLTADIRYSNKMKRHFLNLMMTPTEDFMESTSGLCGIMDDDVTNDLTGPDGTLYNDTTKFVESWRIRNPKRKGAGVAESWSWSESNFHEQDIIDLAYIDPRYKPSYSLAGFTQKQILLATTSCSKLGVSGALLDGCIFDVVITNDTSLAEQETLQTGCPNQCSGKGRCVNGSCVCVEGWSSTDCHIGSCGSCYHGDCKAGFCVCNVGWDGNECSEKARCDGVNHCTDETHGICDKHNKCKCTTGYTGKDCSELAKCYNVANCSDHGACIDHDVCRCDIGYNGTRCRGYSCEGVNFCSGHGLCGEFDVCICNYGWADATCSTPTCDNRNRCSGNGTCVGPDKCECLDGYSGRDCGQLTKCPDLENCNMNGLCVVNRTKGVNDTISCRCFDGFSGRNCSNVDCDDVSGCSRNGKCVEPNLCLCKIGFTGPKCDSFSCELLNRCSGHGTCIQYDKCRCDSKWSGKQCDVPNCLAVNDCSSQGRCIAPDICQCYEGFQGTKCDMPLDANQNAPKFEAEFYNVTIREDDSAGKLLLTIAATDDDTSLNGEIEYALDGTGVNVDITRYLMVDSNTGAVILLQAIPLDATESTVIQPKVVASDKGVPRKATTVPLYTTIIPVNQHCPQVMRPRQNEIIYVNSSSPWNTTIYQVVANDVDFGDTEKFEFLADESALFGITADTGAIYTKTANLPFGDYMLDIAISDRAQKPCITKQTLQIIILPSYLIPTTITTVVITTQPVTTTEVTTAEQDITIAADGTTGATSDIATTQIFVTSKRTMKTSAKPLPTKEPTKESLFFIICIVLAVLFILAIIVIVILTWKVCTNKGKGYEHVEMQEIPS